MFESFLVKASNITIHGLLWRFYAQSAGGCKRSPRSGGRCFWASLKKSYPNLLTLGLKKPYITIIVRDTGTVCNPFQNLKIPFPRNVKFCTKPQSQVAFQEKV
jgi:hypothetical protein